MKTIGIQRPACSQFRIENSVVLMVNVPLHHRGGLASSSRGSLPGFSAVLEHRIPFLKGGPCIVMKTTVKLHLVFFFRIH